MITRYPGKCTKCLETIEAGTDVDYNRDTKTISHKGECVRGELPKAAPTKFTPLVITPGSYEQENIWDYMMEGRGHMVIAAGPGCLVGETFIDCPRDMNKYPAGIRIKDLVGQTPLVYGYDEEKRRIVLRRASRVWKTGNKVPVYKVTFRNAFSPMRNEKVERAPYHVIGTADHPFLLRVPPDVRLPGWNVKPPIPGGWRELSKLKPGDRVIAFLRQICKDDTSINLNDGTTMIESRFILSEMDEPRSVEYHAHHKNHQHLDHSPSNLEWKHYSDHASEHLRKRNLEKTVGWQKSGNHPRGMAGKPQTEHQKAVAGKTHKGVPHTPEHVANMRASRWGGTTPEERREATRAMRDVSYAKQRAKKTANHIVESVEFYGYEDVYNMTVGDCHNFIANGVVTHNTGKTWTAIQYCLRDTTNDILFVAFNKHIANEANGKLAASGCHNVKASTYHSLGYRILRDNFRGSLGAPSQEKMRSIFERICPMPDSNARPEWRRTLNLAEKLAGFAKNYLVDHQGLNFAEEMEKIADRHALEMDSITYHNAIALVPEALEQCKEMADISVDFDDMIWLPVVLGLSPTRVPNRIITDECQDLNAVQHELMMKFVTTGRAFAIGDPRQAIYQFRGAMASSMETLTSRLGQTKRGVKTFPLTITRRCPKIHVSMAQALFPQCVTCGATHKEGAQVDHDYKPSISALENAPMGQIIEEPYSAAVQMMKPGDMVLCRVNKELIKCAYALIRRGIRPVVKGRDIGRGLVALVEKLDGVLGNYRGPREMHRMAEALAAYQQEEMSKLTPLGEKAAGRIAALGDKVECVREFIANSAGIEDLKTRITNLFTDSTETDANSVVLGTIHRTKGLEAERVFVLAPELIPHPAAKRDWEREGERNIAWIAATRAKFTNENPATLVFCGRIPAIYLGMPTMATQSVA